MVERSDTTGQIPLPFFQEPRQGFRTRRFPLAPESRTPAGVPERGRWHPIQALKGQPKFAPREEDEAGGTPAVRQERKTGQAGRLRYGGGQVGLFRSAAVPAALSSRLSTPTSGEIDMDKQDAQDFPSYPVHPVHPCEQQTGT